MQWITDAGGDRPTADDATYESWAEFFNANASHLGERREQAIPWPADADAPQLARYALERVKSLLPQGSSDMHIAVMNALAELGIAYLDTGDESKLDQIADALNKPLPIQARNA